MKMPQHCALQYSLLFTVLAVAANLIKTSILMYMWLGLSNVPLLTIGDAIASFLPCRLLHARSVLSHDALYQTFVQG